MYIIEAKQDYTGRPEYFAGFDAVSRRSAWTEEKARAAQFADAVSAQLFADEPVSGRVANVTRLSPPTMAERFVQLYAQWDEHCIEQYQASIAGARLPDMWEFVRARDPEITALTFWDAVPRGEKVDGIRRMVDVILFDDGSTALRRHDKTWPHAHEAKWSAVS